MYLWGDAARGLPTGLDEIGECGDEVALSYPWALRSRTADAVEGERLRQQYVIGADLDSIGAVLRGVGAGKDALVCARQNVVCELRVGDGAEAESGFALGSDGRRCILQKEEVIAADLNARECGEVDRILIGRAFESLDDLCLVERDVVGCGVASDYFDEDYPAGPIEEVREAVRR